MNFGTRIKHLRMEAHLSQKELAHKIGMHFSYLCRIEASATGFDVKADTVAKFIRAMKIQQPQADELYLAAGRIPPDIESAILTTPELLNLLRRKVGNGQHKPR